MGRNRILVAVAGACLVFVGGIFPAPVRGGDLGDLESLMSRFGGTGDPAGMRPSNQRLQDLTPQSNQALRDVLEQLLSRESQMIEEQRRRGEISEEDYRRKTSILDGKRKADLEPMDRLARGEIDVAEFSRQGMANLEAKARTTFEGETAESALGKLNSGAIDQRRFLQINEGIEYEYYVRSGRFGGAGNGGGTTGIRASNPAASSTSSSDPVAQMKKLKEMLDGGLITEEEFAAKKAEILKSL